jgi:hypothetical protein
MSNFCLFLPVPSLSFVSLCPLLSSGVCPLTVSICHSTVCLFCVTMSTVVFYSLSSLCQYISHYRLLFLCHYVHCCILQSVYFLPVTHTELSVVLLPLLALLSSKLCPLSVSTSHCTVFRFRVIMSTTVFYILSTVCQYLTLHRLLVLCRYVHCCLLQSTHCLSVPHIVPSVSSVSLCLLLTTTNGPLSVSISQFTVC